MTIRSYAQADSLLTGRNAKSRKLANNTYLERHDDSIVIRLHNTDIVFYFPDGRIVFTSGDGVP